MYYRDTLRDILNCYTALYAFLGRLGLDFDCFFSKTNYLNIYVDFCKFFFNELVVAALPDFQESKGTTMSKNFLAEQLVCVGGIPPHIDRGIGQRSNDAEPMGFHYFLLLSSPVFGVKSLWPNVARTAKINALLSA